MTIIPATGQTAHLFQVLDQVSVPTANGHYAILSQVDAHGTRGVGYYNYGLTASMRDDASVATAPKTVTNCANNGAGLIRVTCTGHGFATNDWIAVYGVVGATQANGAWQVTVIDANTFDLQTSAFSSAYVSGGKATNRQGAYGVFVSLLPKQPRSDTLTGTAAHADDFGGFGVFNGSANNSIAGGGYNVNNNGAFVGDQFIYGYLCEAKVVNAFSIAGNCSQFGLDFTGLGVNPAYGIGAMRLPNSVSVYGRNAANSADIQMFAVNNINEMNIYPTLRITGNTIQSTGSSMNFDDTVNLNLGTSTGSKIGTGTTQKLGFWNATPVTQPNTTGETVGFTTGAGTAVKDDSTFTGNVGTKAYRVSDIVKHLKNVGIIASS